MLAPTNRATLDRILRLHEPIQDRDLRSVDWNGLNAFSQKKFSHVDLRGVELEGREFIQCEFNDVSFDEARLGAARFIQCTFDEASFVRTSLAGARFSQCELRGAHLVETILTHTEFQSCEFSRPTFSRLRYAGASFEGCEGLDDVIGEPLPDHVRYRSFSSIPSDRRWPFALKWAERLAARVGGEVVADEGAGVLRVRGATEGRRYTVEIHTTWGSVRLRAVLDNRALPVTLQGGTPAPRVATPDEDLRGPDPNAPTTLLLREGVYLEGPPGRVELERIFLDHHASARDAMAAFVVDGGLRALYANSDSWDLNIRDSLVGPGLIERVVAAILALPSWSRPFEEGAAPPAARPHAAAQEVVHPSVVACAYCRQRTWLDIDRRCRFCGAPN